METIAFYLFKSTVWLTGFALVYLLFLRNERYFGLNRLFLLAGVLASLIFPLITLRYPIEIPAAGITGSGELETVGMVATGNRTPDGRVALLILYIAGLLWFGWRIIRQTVQVLSVIRKAQVSHVGAVKVIKTAGYPSSFSFFSFVVVNPSITDAETREIINHEQEHIRQQHWFDLLLVELLCMVQWFNPVVWLYGRFVRQNHEFLADEKALQRTSNPAIYRAALLNQMFGGPVVSLANSFNYSLNKKRFQMMKKTMVSPLRKVKILTILPVVAILFWAFAKPEYAANSLSGPAVALSLDGKMVKGQVTNENGDAVAGAAVILKGTTTGTLSDTEGVFMLDGVPANGELVISYVGYKTASVKPDFNNEIKVVLERTVVEIKDGVVVIGYGNQKPSPSGASVQIRPTDGTKGSPLFIQDGKEITKAEMDKIDPNAIEAISVLKDKSATELYGEKGKDGVIVITMKGQKPQEPKKTKPVATETTKVDGKDVFVIVEQMPEFPGGEAELKKYVAMNVRYPAEASKAGVQGKVFVTFVVGDDGKVTNAKVVRGVHPLLDQEAIRVVSELPQWAPGMQRGKAVAVAYTIPIEFKLQ